MISCQMEATDKKYRIEAEKFLERSKKDNFEHNKLFLNLQVLNLSVEANGIPIG